MKKTSNNDKNSGWEILCYLLIVFFLFLACKNYYNLSHLEKFGIIETAIIKSYSIKSHIEGSGTYYHVKIEYSLLGENLKQICSFDFKPSEEYYENKRIQIIHDSKNDFKLPITEEECIKNIIILILLVPFLLIQCLIEWIKERFNCRKRNK